MATPDVVSKLSMLEDGDWLRIETQNGHVVEGVIEWMDVYLDTERKEDRDAFALVMISEEKADETGSGFCTVTVGATRLSHGWSDVEVTYVDDVEDGQEKCELLGVVEEIERID